VNNSIRPGIFEDITGNSTLNFPSQVVVSPSSQVPGYHTMIIASAMGGGGLESQGFGSSIPDSTFTFSSHHPLHIQNQGLLLPIPSNLNATYRPSPTLTKGNEDVENIDFGGPFRVLMPSNASVHSLAAAQYSCDCLEG
jgi:hypothetical protein